MKVDVQAMDWQTLVSRRALQNPVSERGWNSPYDLGNIDIGNPVSALGRPGQGQERRRFAGPRMPRSRSCATTTPARPTR